MRPKLSDYRRIIGREETDRIRELAEPLKAKHVVHMNATASGGGVSEMLNSLVFLQNDVGLKAGWRVMFGSHSFFKVTKHIHNALQGGECRLGRIRRDIYGEFCERNAILNHISEHDVVVVHDPQPAGIIKDIEKKCNWIWRCHIDLSHPNPSAMNFMRPFLNRYDRIVVSKKEFKIKGLKKPQSVIHPAIDPLSRKNMKISRALALKEIKNKGIDLDKPIITQISRFDPWKNPLGVLKMYEEIREKEDCQLVLLGDMADDDPQGKEILYQVVKRAEGIEGVHIITEKNDLLANALQQESAFIFQNSKREGFGLTVTESMWKKTPVISRPVGGIPLQISHGKTGYLIKKNSEGVKHGIRLLRDPDMKSRMGEKAKEHVRRNFLITRLLKDHLRLCGEFYCDKSI